MSQVVYVCTIHYKTLDRGVWKTSRWSETMAQRYSLILKEGIYNSCMADARTVLAWQMEQRWKPAHAATPLPSTTPLSA